MGIPCLVCRKCLRWSGLVVGFFYVTRGTRVFLDIFSLGSTNGLSMLVLDYLLHHSSSGALRSVKMSLHGFLGQGLRPKSTHHYNRTRVAAVPEKSMCG